MSADGDARLAGGRLRERADELQRRGGPDAAPADQLARAAARRDVLPERAARPPPAPRRQPREGQGDRPAAVGAPQAGRLEQTQAHADRESHTSVRPGSEQFCSQQSLFFAVQFFFGISAVEMVKSFINVALSCLAKPLSHRVRDQGLGQYHHNAISE